MHGTQPSSEELPKPHPPDVLALACEFRAETDCLYSDSEAWWTPPSDEAAAPLPEAVSAAVSE